MTRGIVLEAAWMVPRLRLGSAPAGRAPSGEDDLQGVGNRHL
jgi:hypothetical protein